ncbi:hypothetical protein [Micromonospora sp. DPT]|uniref:DUF7574 domain-containing protein n=1 Tax=Micromonospora sp. DPT TaxID=3142975 RepID=UPI00320ABE1A
MSYMYGDPEKFGLTTVGEIDWSSGSYEFDLTVVWQRKFDGVFVYGEDSGCSCPAPFESTGVDELTQITSLESFKQHLAERRRDGYYDRSDEVARLLERLHGLGLR